MTRVAQVDGDMHVSGTLSAGNIQIPAGSVDNADVEAAAGIEATKLMHQYALSYHQTTGSDVAAGQGFIHTFRSASSIVAMDVTPITAPTTGDKKFSVDLHKGSVGSAFATVLSAVITIGQTDVDRTSQAAVISATTAIDGDMLKVVVTSTGSTGNQGKGVLVTVWTRENP
jgi:hypothetical protein